MGGACATHPFELMQNKPRQRRFETKRSVIFADRFSTFLITTGGLGTILAVLGVMLFLVSVVVPLFLPGSKETVSSTQLDIANTPIRVGTDEYRTMGWALFRDGDVSVFRLADGTPIDTVSIPIDAPITAVDFSLQSDDCVLGLANGKLWMGAIGIRSTFIDKATLSQEINDNTIVDGAMVAPIPGGQLRRQQLFASFTEPVLAATDSATIVALDMLVDDEVVVAAVTINDDVALLRVVERENFLTGETTSTVERSVIPSKENSSAQTSFVFLDGTGRQLLVIGADGRLLRFDISDPDDATLVESLQVADGSAAITAVEQLIGKSTLLVGDKDGTVSTWFTANVGSAANEDGLTTVRPRAVRGNGTSVVVLSSSPRTRVFAVAHPHEIDIYQATTNAKLLTLSVESDETIQLLTITPKDDGVVAVTNKRVLHWKIDQGYPEATLASLFRPVWYEGYGEPEHVWQSSSGTDDFEPKLGMWPLVFGTLKATFYSMLFGAPLALLAALFGSEFLAPSLRSRVKTLIEFMAGLPSVVLGFLAALVFAPFVQKVLPASLAVFFTVPLAMLVAAYLWQLLPNEWATRLDRYRLMFLLAVLPVGVAWGFSVGPNVERWLFVGDLRLWLNGNEGSPVGGWTILFLPIAAMLVITVITRSLGPWSRSVIGAWNPRQVALFDICRFLVGAVLTVAIAFFAASALTQLGLDSRGAARFFDTYVQRNALIVGVVMGFAIIPIIYTIAEDALSSVPDHLRAASLGAGATKWQTATRIVIPAAMSGLFSALMIGLGRAVGETMIVLMAAGNTPILDINIFSGFRTLSANIAVELPEAVRNSTHYRTLFFSALILFAMTFVINTVAETVRMRFRKRSSQL